MFFNISNSPRGLARERANELGIDHWISTDRSASKYSEFAILYSAGARIIHAHVRTQFVSTIGSFCVILNEVRATRSVTSFDSSCRTRDRYAVPLKYATKTFPHFTTRKIFGRIKSKNEDDTSRRKIATSTNTLRRRYLNFFQRATWEIISMKYFACAMHHKVTMLC